MVSTEEKREIIKLLMEQYGETRQVEDVQMKLHELLLRDTENGKLYKYRSFDCKIGITFNSLCAEMYSSKYELMDNIFENFIKVLNDEINIEDCPADEGRIIKNFSQAMN